ncbi:MAG: lysoplasmalogenase [Myxococcales bacterium]|nr:lysoplasmalogenase [Myxococcales bacterium]
MTAAIVATAACALAVALLVAAERAGDRRRRFLWKPLASAAFVALPLVGGAFADGGDRTLAVWIVVGLGFGALGDVALMFESDRGFLAGLVAFLLGHVAYVVGLARVTAPGHWLDGAMIGAAPAAVVAAGVILRWLWPRLGPMRIPVIGYVAVITAMLIGGLAATLVDGERVAIPTARHLLTAGAAAFFASDLAVAREKFIGRDPLNRTLGLPVYYGAQLLFAWALVVR